MPGTGLEQSNEQTQCLEHWVYDLEGEGHYLHNTKANIKLQSVVSRKEQKERI